MNEAAPLFVSSLDTSVGRGFTPAASVYIGYFRWDARPPQLEQHALFQLVKKVPKEGCHCEEQSDVAIRISQSTIFFRFLVKTKHFRKRMPTPVCALARNERFLRLV